MKVRLSALIAGLALVAAPAAWAVEYKNLEDFALSTFDACGKVISEGAAADAAFKAMGYGPADKPDTWVVDGGEWASMVTVHIEKLQDGRTYAQCVTTFTPQPKDPIAFNADFLSHVVADGVGVDGKVRQDGQQTVTSYVDKARGLILNIGNTAGKTPDEASTTSLTYSVVTP